MNRDTIELAVIRICREIYSSNRQSWWLSADESDLLFELVSCILGSQVHYEMALTAAEEIRNAGLLKKPTKRFNMSGYEKVIYNIIRRPLHNPIWRPEGRCYRFARPRANQISRTVWAIYSDGASIHGRLQTYKTDTEARRSIVEIAAGVGPKQASLFLRNIGFSDELAILDTHLLRFMSIFGWLDQTIRVVTSLRNYENLENHLRFYAKSIGYSLGCVDLAIWITMRVYLSEMRA